MNAASPFTFGKKTHWFCQCVLCLGVSVLVIGFDELVDEGLVLINVNTDNLAIGSNSRRQRGCWSRHTAGCRDTDESEDQHDCEEYRQNFLLILNIIWVI